MHLRFLFSLRFNNQWTKKANNHVYINDAYLTGSGGQAIEMKGDNSTYSLSNVSDIKPKEQF